MIAHKQSLEERNLLDKNLVELVEIMDDKQFIQAIKDFDYMMIL
jgi:sulfur relay (sulfurtransferase) DsrF/TusC family protein